MDTSLKEKMEDTMNHKIPDGYKRTSEGIIPADWDFVQLQEVVRVFRGASPRPKGDSRYYGGDIPRVLIEDVTRDGKYVYPCIDSLTEEGAKKSRLLPKGSVVLSCSGTRVAIPGILAIPACIHDGFFGFDDYKELAPEYLYYIFSLLHEKMQSSATTGGVFNNLTTQIMKEMYIHLPPQKEQTEIVKILNKWDKAIELKEKLIEQKKEQKKGLMQKLLTGEVRLPGFDGEWEEYEVQEICSLGRGRVISKKEIAKNIGTYPVYSSQTSDEGKIGSINTYDFDGEYITWTTDGANAGTVFYRNGKFNCTNVCGILKLNKDNIDARYLSYILQANTDKYVVRHGNPKLMNNIMAIIPVRIFNNYNYQKYICDIFDVLDKEIKLFEKEVKEIKHQKQGLMQQLLTGKIRVKV